MQGMSSTPVTSTAHNIVQVAEEKLPVSARVNHPTTRTCKSTQNIPRTTPTKQTGYMESCTSYVKSLSKRSCSLALAGISLLGQLPTTTPYPTFAKGSNDSAINQYDNQRNFWLDDNYDKSFEVFVPEIVLCLICVGAAVVLYEQLKERRCPPSFDQLVDTRPVDNNQPDIDSSTDDNTNLSRNIPPPSSSVVPCTRETSFMHSSQGIDSPPSYELAISQEISRDDGEPPSYGEQPPSYEEAMNV